jgi:hypothetical protein
MLPPTRGSPALSKLGMVNGPARTGKFLAFMDRDATGNAQAYG